MSKNRIGFSLVFCLVIVVLATSACSSFAQTVPTKTATPEINFEQLERDPDIPDLPFSDNPDPNKCGIPIQWGSDEPAWVSGYYQGELVQSTVLVYDSHLRLSIAGAIPNDTEVKVILYQENPTLDYYLVKTVDVEPVQEGWIPAPFLSFEPPN